MKAVTVRQLRDNPSEALREARKRPVIVLDRHQPEALLVHQDDNSLLAEPGIRRSLATALYRDRSLSLGRAARFARVRWRVLRYVSGCGIPVVRGTAAEVGRDAQAIVECTRGSSGPTRAR